MNPNSSIVEKIQKLQALADRAGTEAEAALAAEKVAELCRQHNLDIGIARLEQEETEASEAEHVHESSRWQAHYSGIAGACGALFSVGYYRKPCGIVVKDSRGNVASSKDGQAVVFYGLKASVQSAILTYEYLLASVESLLEGYIREGHYLKGQAEFRSFRMGCSARIYAESKKLQQASSQHLIASSESTALVRLENKLQVAHRTKLRLRSAGGYSGAASRDHYSAGYAAGGRVDLHGARSNRMLR